MNFDANIELSFRHRIRFTEDTFRPANPVLRDCIETTSDRPARMLAFVDTHVAEQFPTLSRQLRAYAETHADRIELIPRVEPVPGGELCKNDRDAIYRVLNAIERAHLDRQSYVLVIGGGAVLDCVGFAAAVAHRGIRLIRLPTTTLAQADSGIGVKNGINGFEKKNYLGAFAVPAAVINDQQFLPTLDDTNWRAGFSEAVKVALIKDHAFFHRICDQAHRIRERDMDAAMPVIQRSAQLHLEHIAYGGDPFEMTEARPLDFGHWSAHKLEQMTDFQLGHGEAVALGLALDVLYSHRLGMIAREDVDAVWACLRSLGFSLYHPLMLDTDCLLEGLEEFREHLGGRLTITLLASLGRGVDVHEIDDQLMRASIKELAEQFRHDTTSAQEPL